MDNALIALCISIFSVLVASLSLGWNVYRDVILKPKDTLINSHNRS